MGYVRKISEFLGFLGVGVIVRGVGLFHWIPSWIHLWIGYKSYFGWRKVYDESNRKREEMREY